ncbi:MAG: hypothetical protein ACTSV2_06740 [Candidatus Thorarchaeota archaeon]
MQKPRLLQIWDITCSSATISSYLEKNGWRCKVIIREAFHKNHCSKEFHDYVMIPGGIPRFYLSVLYTIRKFRPNLIVVRQNSDVLPLIKLVAPFTPIVMHFHGAEVRNRKTLPWQAKLATRRLASTRDITKWGEYYGTPINPMFKPPKEGVRKARTALFIRIKQGAKDCIEEAKAIAKERGLELTIKDRTTGSFIAHEKMPEMLQRFEWYFDLKGLTSKTVLSKTAIEFLHTTSPESPGKVITDTGDVVTSFHTTSLEDYLELFNSLVS